MASEALKYWEGENEDISGTYEGAIVLGGYGNWNNLHHTFNFNESSDRLLYAFKLYRNQEVRKIILTGGSGMITKQREKESRFVRDYLNHLCIYPEDILVEDESRNTFENAVNTAKLLRERFPIDSRFLLITTASHMRRAKACFEKQGVVIECLRVDFQVDDDDYTLSTILIPSLSALQTWRMLFKEMLGYRIYQINGYL
ncbi:MAG: YdcF family protein [Vicingaceae bacterium]